MLFSLSMVYVFILNLLGAALCAVITSIILEGLKGKAILNNATGAKGRRWWSGDGGGVLAHA